MTSKNLQDCLALADVVVHESTSRQILTQNAVHGSVARREPLLSKKNNAACAKVGRDHMDKPEGNWKNALWTDETKIELSVLKEKCYI